MTDRRFGKEGMRIKLLCVGILVLFGPALLFAGSDSQSVLLLVDPYALPDSRPSFTFMLPATEIAFMTTDRSLMAQFERTRVIVVELQTLTRLEKKHEPDLRAFLRNSIEDGRQIWIIGVSIPDNFVQDYLGLQTSLRIHRREGAHHVIASGIWKQGKNHMTKDILTASVLPRQEIIKRILNQD